MADVTKINGYIIKDANAPHPSNAGSAGQVLKKTETGTEWADASQTVTIPETTALLKGDGVGGVAAATTDATPTQGSTNPVQSGGVYTALANKLDKTGDGSNVTAAFTAASSRENIATGENLGVLFGKIAKWFSDLGSLAFKSSVTKSDVGLGNVDNVKQYSTSNPPPYPVTSVNGQTGDVEIQSGSEAASHTATLTTTGWATAGSYQKQTVTVTGLKASYPVSPVVDAQLSGTDADGDAAILTAFAAVNILQTAANQLIAYCIGDAPNTNIPLIINTWG